MDRVGLRFEELVRAAGRYKKTAGVTAQSISRQMVSGFMTSREAPFWVARLGVLMAANVHSAFSIFLVQNATQELVIVKDFAKLQHFKHLQYLVGTLKKFAGHLRDVSLGAKGAMHRRSCPCDLTRTQS